MSNKDQRTGRSSKNPYRVTVRGEVPADLPQRISALHAMAILHRSKKGAKADGEPNDPPPEKP